MQGNRLTHGFRIQSGKLDYPFKFSAANKQEDNTKLLIHSSENLVSLERFAFDGRDFYMTKFIDYRSPDRFYRKHRFFVIGGKVYPGFLIVSNQWLIQSDDQARSTFPDFPESLAAEEKAFLTKFRKKEISILEEIYRVADLGFLGIDCAFDEIGRPIVFGAGGNKHHHAEAKAQRYYSDKMLKQLDHSVERMISKTLHESRNQNG